MPDDKYDDGLVHSHGWAREAMPEGITRLISPSQPPTERTSAAAAPHQGPDDRHDDGLVHNHSWARQPR